MPTSSTTGASGTATNDADATDAVAAVADVATRSAIRSLDECTPFVAGDETTLREFFNPATDPSLPFHYSLAHATVPPGAASQPHALDSSEVYYILSGEGVMHLGDTDTSRSVGAGDAVSIAPGVVQWIENRGATPLRFLCIVDPAWRAEDETVL